MLLDCIFHGKVCFCCVKSLILELIGTEPLQRGQYNDDYLSVIKTIVRKAAKYGIMVILDVHQDVMTDLFCGEGLFLVDLTLYNSSFC